MALHIYPNDERTSTFTKHIRQEITAATVGLYLSTQSSFATDKSTDRMPNFIVNCKEDASDADIADAKKSVEQQGGTIKDV